MSWRICPKNLLRALFCVIFFLVCLFAFLNPKPVKTDILSAVFSSCDKNAAIALASRSSNTVNLIIEADDPLLISSVKDEILKSLPNNFSSRANFKENPAALALFEFYTNHPMNFLSENDFRLLSQNKTAEIKNNALNALYSPFSFSPLPLSLDPYFFFSNFLSSLANSAFEPDLAEYDGKYYSLLPLSLDKHLSKKAQTASMKALDAIVKTCNDKFQKTGVNLYLSGVLAHSYYTASKSALEINIISILSFAFAFFLCFSYFKTSRVFFPVCVNILLGFLFAFCLTSLVFSEVHIFAFVFSTAMIGVCIDYSLHYFVENNVSKIIKSLTASFFTTVLAFLILLFSNLFLLKQIALFTISALFFTYFATILFYPLLPPKFKPCSCGFNFFSRESPLFFWSEKCAIFLRRNLLKLRIFIFLTVFLILTLGLFKLKFEDNIKTMYTPKGRLLKAETIFANAFKNFNPKGYILVSGQNVLEVIENEEQVLQFLPSSNYLSLSKFIPSKMRQKANFNLISNFYKNDINSLSYLSFAQKNTLLNKKYSETLTPSGDLTFFADDFFVEDFSSNNSLKTSAILLFSPLDYNVFAKIENLKFAKFVDPVSEISLEMKNFRLKTLRLLPFIFVCVSIFLIFAYGLKNGLKILAPSFFGSIFPVCLLSLFGQNINLFHILGVILILGFSLDYSIFRLSGIKKTNDAVFISCATTVFSFGMLSITSFKLISSLGFVLAVGIFSSYILSLLLISNKSADDTAAI